MRRITAGADGMGRLWARSFGRMAMIERILGRNFMRELARAAFAVTVAVAFSSTSDAQTHLWYYCATTHQFYPYTQNCSVPWRAVRPYHAVPLEQPRNLVPQQDQAGSDTQPDASNTQNPQQDQTGNDVQPEAQGAQQDQSDSGAQDNPPPDLRSSQDNSQAGSPPTDQTTTRDQTPPESENRAEPPPQPTISQAAPAPAVTEQTGNQDNDSTEKEAWLLIVLLVVGALSWPVIGGIWKFHNKRVLTGKVMEAMRAIVSQHGRALSRKRLQLLRNDDYGVPITAQWHKEITNFTERVLDPAIRQMGPKAHALYETMGLIVFQEIEDLTKGFSAAKQDFSLAADATPTEYEHHCATLLRQAGWSSNTTKASGDQGVDVIAEKEGRRLVVQCKLYSQPVGNSAVQEIFTARQHEKADWAAVVSNTSYTIPAQQLAATTGVFLLHHSDLPDIDKIILERQLSVLPVVNAEKLFGFSPVNP